MDPVFSLDLERRFTSLNVAAQEISGCPADEAIGLPFDPFVVPSDRKRVRAHFEGVVHGRSATIEFQVRHVEGRIVDVHVTLGPIVVGGEVVGASAWRRTSPSAASSRTGCAAKPGPTC